MRMPVRRVPLVACATLIMLLATAARDAPAQTPGVSRADSAQAAFRRAQRLVTDGQGAEGRALVDSMLNAAEPGAPEEAEALFWRATLAESWEAAQRDYLRIMLEHDRSPRAGDAMLRLAQGESARGDREAAVRYLERLAREAPEAPARAEAGLWHGRILIERGERAAGCGVLRETRGRVRVGALELENQYDYLLRACPEPGAVAPAPVAPTAPAPTAPTAPSARSPRPAPPPAAAPAPTSAARGPIWSVQVAALSTVAEANAIVARLRARGYDTRVDGTAAPFRVRFGMFPSRAAALAALERYKAREKADAFLVEVPRG
jgi:tetratricopeptide (TPR) repeat protein